MHTDLITNLITNSKDAMYMKQAAKNQILYEGKELIEIARQTSEKRQADEQGASRFSKATFYIRVGSGGTALNTGEKQSPTTYFI